MRNSIVPLSLLALLPACALGEFHAFTDDLDAQGTESGSTIGDADSSGDLSGPISTVTSATNSSSGEPTAGDTDGATSEVDATTGDAAGPPSISDYSLTPDPITSAGIIAVKILADGDGVRMDADGVVVELTATEPGVFEGEIFAFSGFDNGGVAVFTPWRGDGLGAALEVPYTVQLPAPGGEALFDVDYESGSGQVSAIGALPEGGVELVTLVSKNNISGCYLRRRDELGISGPDDLFALLPDHCKGIDLRVHDGVIYALMEAETLKGGQWWVAKISHWGSYHTVVATGQFDEVAHALAISSGGIIAICGSAPTVQPKDLADAFVRIVGPDFSYARTFDYVVEDAPSHTFDEQANGCAFDPNDDSRLILVGDVFGRHTAEILKTNRRFDLVYDLETDGGDLRVADTGLGAFQSVASDTAVDDQGRSFIVGIVCGNDVCDQVEGRMWILDSDGDLTSTRSLGLHSNKALGPSQIRLSPAGYLVVTSGGLASSEVAFLVRAYDPLKADPLWTYSRQDGGLVHFAHALAIGPYGQVYAGGFGANGYPLFVVIDG